MGRDFRTVVSLLGAGELGTLHAFESRYERWQPQVPSDPDRAWKRDASPSAAAGIVHDLGTHLVDQAVVLFGRPDAVYAEVARRRPGGEVDDDAFIALRHANGMRYTSGNRGPLRTRVRGFDFSEAPGRTRSQEWTFKKPP